MSPQSPIQRMSFMSLVPGRYTCRHVLRKPLSRSQSLYRYGCSHGSKQSVRNVRRRQSKIGTPSNGVRRRDVRAGSGESTGDGRCCVCGDCFLVCTSADSGWGGVGIVVVVDPYTETDSTRNELWTEQRRQKVVSRRVTSGSDGD